MLIKCRFKTDYTQITLTCQIIVQDHLIVSVADSSEIKKHGGPNKAMQVEFFLIYVGENQVLRGKSKKLINVQVLIRLCRCFFSPTNKGRFVAQLFGRSEQVRGSKKAPKYRKLQGKICRTWQVKNGRKTSDVIYGRYFMFSGNIPSDTIFANFNG